MWIAIFDILCIFCFFRLFHGQIPEIHREPIISHIVHVHQSLKHYTQQFLLKLRRKNFVTPKHYLDFINTYLKLIGWYFTGFCFSFGLGISGAARGFPWNSVEFGPGCSAGGGSNSQGNTVQAFMCKSIKEVLFDAKQRCNNFQRLGLN